MTDVESFAVLEPTSDGFRNYLGKGHTLRAEELIVDKASDRVVGVHMVGPDAGEIMQGIAIALRAGATKALFDTTIGIHPTAAEEFVTMREAWTED